MDELRPRRIVHIDLADGVPHDGLDAAGGPVLLVVWWRDLPLGYEHVHRGVSATELAARLARLAGPSVGRRLLGDGFPPPRPGLQPDRPPSVATVRALERPLRALDSRPAAHPSGAPPTTLAICTRDRPAALERCLRSVAEAVEAPHEVLVIDNAPHAASTRDVVARFPAVRLVSEPRPGLSAARNAAVREASGDVIAFVDDDVVVNPRWLAPLRRAFAEPDVMAVTGLVLPAELETEAQVAFETVHGGFAQGCEAARYDRAFLRATAGDGMPVWKIGAGANMAIRRSAFALVGDFDERLGAGAAGCSED
jgi:hypothetical protein